MDEGDLARVMEKESQLADPAKSLSMMKEILEIRGYRGDAPLSQGEFSMTKKPNLVMTAGESKTLQLSGVPVGSPVWLVSLGKSCTKKVVEDVVKVAKKAGVVHIILLSRNKSNASNKRTLFTLSSELGSGGRIESFTYQETQKNVLRHEDVPLHVIVPQKPETRYRDLYDSDIVVRLMGYRAGDCVRVEYKGIVDHTLYYKIRYQDVFRQPPKAKKSTAKGN